MEVTSILKVHCHTRQRLKAESGGPEACAHHFGDTGLRCGCYVASHDSSCSPMRQSYVHRSRVNETSWIRCAKFAGDDDCFRAGYAPRACGGAREQARQEHARDAVGQRERARDGGRTACPKAIDKHRIHSPLKVCASQEFCGPGVLARLTLLSI